MIRSLSALALATAAFAQEPPTVRSFLFPDCEHVLELDLKAMRERGIWDELQATAFAMALPQAERELGFPLTDIDRVLVNHDLPPGNEMRDGYRRVVIFVGSKPLGWSPQPWRATPDLGEPIGAGFVRGGDAPFSIVEARVANLALAGHRCAIEPVLAGTPHNGQPAADVLSLQGDRRNLVGFTAVGLRADLPPRALLRELLPNVSWPEEYHPTFAAFRLSVHGDDDDPRLRLEMILRHAVEGEGLAITEREVDAALAKLREQPQARLFAPLLRRIERHRHGIDAVWTLDLGRAREAAGHIGTLVPMLLMGNAHEVEAVQVEVVEPPPPPPPAEEKGGG